MYEVGEHEPCHVVTFSRTECVFHLASPWIPEFGQFAKKNAVRSSAQCGEVYVLFFLSCVRMFNLFSTASERASHQQQAFRKWANEDAETQVEVRTLKSKVADELATVEHLKEKEEMLQKAILSLTRSQVDHSVTDPWASRCVDLCTSLGVFHPRHWPSLFQPLLQAFFQTRVSSLLNHFLRDRLVDAASSLTVCHV